MRSSGPQNDWSDRISVFRSGLSLIHCVDENTNRIDIWLMREYGVVESWTKYFTLDLDLGPYMYSSRNVVGFSKNGALILEGIGNKGRVVWVNECVEMPQVVELEMESRRWSWHVETYVQCLLLVEGGEELPPPCTG